MDKLYDRAIEYYELQDKIEKLSASAKIVSIDKSFIKISIIIRRYIKLNICNNSIYIINISKNCFTPCDCLQKIKN